MSVTCNSPFNIGALTLPTRLIQGPLAGFSCAPFRTLYSHYTPPAYCVSEMISAYDVLHKHAPDSRYLYRAPNEERLCYQLAGSDPSVLAKAAARLEAIGADLIDLNCGCPKTKIRKKGAGSALLDTPHTIMAMINAIREAIQIPLTVKIRIQGDARDIALAKAIATAGANALIVHGRRWVDNYDTPCDWSSIASIKQALSIPVIANGDISNRESLADIMAITQCDAYMIARAGSGNPWLYEHLVSEREIQPPVTHAERIYCFMTHLRGLSQLENEHKALLQSKTLVRYYFGKTLNPAQLQAFYTLNSLQSIEYYLGKFSEPCL